jgi:GNAT superfamily N-acetyltransferase
MDKDPIVALYTQDQRIDVQYPNLRREVVENIVRQVNTTPEGDGAVIYSRLDKTGVEDAIREQVSYFESIGQGFEWKVYDYDTPPNLKERLAAHGFEVEDPDAIMVLDLEEAPEILFQPTRHMIRRITRPEGIKDVIAIEEAVWDGDYSGLGRFLGRTLAEHPQQLGVYVAYVDEVPASVGWIIFPERSQFGSLWGGSTLHEYRGRGLYTSLLGVRAQEARERQVRYLTVDASPMSRPILEKFGFQVIAFANACKWEVGKSGIGDSGLGESGTPGSGLRKSGPRP